MSRFLQLEQLPADPILSIATLFQADPRPFKVNLGIGAYLDETLRPVVMEAVTQAEAKLFSRQLDKEYAPIGGQPQFCKLISELLIGEALSAQLQGDLVALQTVGGAGGLYLAGRLLQQLGHQQIHLPDPTWANHAPLFHTSTIEAVSYPYFDPQSHALRFEALCDYLEQLQPESAVLWHGCCHNPTGVDPTSSQWDQLLEIIARKRLLPLFDLAYIGLGEGWEVDCEPVRRFLVELPDLLLTFSCSKSFGLYGERLGLLLVKTSSRQAIAPIESQLYRMARSTYSNPPRHGAQIIEELLGDSQLRVSWATQLEEMRQRVYAMREKLSVALETKVPERSWGWMKKEKGFFSLLGLTPEQVLLLRKEQAIYMPSSGRINVAGLAPSQIEYVAEAIARTVKQPLVIHSH